MRVFAVVSLIALWLFAADVRAQSDAAKQKFDKAVRAVRAKQYQRALDDFRGLLKELPPDESVTDFQAQIRYNIGVCCFHLRRFAEAVAQYEKAVALSADKYQKAFYALGMAHVALKNWRAAETAFAAARTFAQN